MTRSPEEAVIYIIQNARFRDRVEMKALRVPGQPGPIDMAAPLWQMAKWKRIFYDRNNNPACFVMFHPMTVKALAASLIATDSFREIAPELLKWGLKEFKPQALANGYKRLECRTLSGHHDAIKLLERLNFRREVVLKEYGAEGQTFLQYAWRLSDNVFQHPEDSEGPAAAPKRGCAGSEGQ
jgi:hypothetical protein